MSVQEHGHGGCPWWVHAALLTNPCVRHTPSASPHHWVHTTGSHLVTLEWRSAGDLVTQSQTHTTLTLATTDHP